MEPKKDWNKISTIEMHTGGEPLQGRIAGEVVEEEHGQSGPWRCP